ncbi:MAG: NADH-quinone oxidoreductase subunit H [Chrysiogenetes bacterium]|nr:NADH-quinone oxidoreductase subunit H [Chrysiogenetes bacterium]
MDLLDIGMMVLRIALMLLIVLQTLPLLIWMERKASAYMQDRRGPTYAHAGPVRMFGMVHTLTDVVKLIGKEDVTPQAAYKPFHFLAPAIAMSVALVTFAVIPYAGTVQIGERAFPMQVAQLDVGILYILAIASLGVYAVILASWASNNKYTMFGGLRASAQIISYELVMALCLLALIMVNGSLRLDQIVTHQGSAPWNWGVVVQPIAAILFVVCAFAETNRNPFDLPEGESEIVAGFHIEYSSLRFALFFMAEYAHMIVASAIITSLFFGGYKIPFVESATLVSSASPILTGLLWVTLIGGSLMGAFFSFLFVRGNERGGKDIDAAVLAVVAGFGPAAAAALVLLLTGFSPELGATGASIFASVLQLLAFMAKTIFFCFLFIWVRWTLPRFRYDQLMTVGWKYMLPLALLNVLVTGLILYGKDVG